jgi:hypothetical protein
VEDPVKFFQQAALEVTKKDAKKGGWAAALQILMTICMQKKMTMTMTTLHSTR